MTNRVNEDIKKVLGRVKEAQSTLQTYLKKQVWVEEARKYAEKQGKEVRKLLSSDLGKVKTFIEKERKELEKFQKQLPGEVAKLRTFVKGQRKELQKLLIRVGKANSATTKTTKKRSTKTSRSKSSA
jgi:hypothetical protein